MDHKDQRDALIQLADEQWRKGWWDRYAGDVETWFADYVWLEDRTEEMRTFDLTLVHGLLQTPEYAATQIQAVNPEASASQRKRWLDLRLNRQQILQRDNPTRLTCVLDESAIRRPIGGPRVMADQLAHLRRLAARPYIEIHVLPLAVGAHAGHDGGFRLLRMADPFPEVGYVESQAGALYLETTDAERLAARYDRLYQSALSASASIDLISAAEKEFRDQDRSPRA